MTAKSILNLQSYPELKLVLPFSNKDLFSLMGSL